MIAFLIVACSILRPFFGRTGMIACNLPPLSGLVLLEIALSNSVAVVGITLVAITLIASTSQLLVGASLQRRIARATISMLAVITGLSVGHLSGELMTIGLFPILAFLCARTGEGFTDAMHYQLFLIGSSLLWLPYGFFHDLCGLIFAQLIQIVISAVMIQNQRHI